MGYTLIPEEKPNEVSGQWPPSRAAPFKKETLATHKDQRRLIRPLKFAFDIQRFSLLAVAFSGSRKAQISNRKTPNNTNAEVRKLDNQVSA